MDRKLTLTFNYFMAFDFFSVAVNAQFLCHREYLQTTININQVHELMGRKKECYPIYNSRNVIKITFQKHTQN